MSSYVAVFLIDDDGTTKIVAPQLNKENLLHFSSLAARQLARGGPHDEHINRHAITLPRGSAESFATANVTA